MHPDHSAIQAYGALAPFRRCTTRELRRLNSLITHVSVESGRVLARQGSRGGEFTVIADGTAIVNRNGYDVDELGPGEAFGEIPLVGRVPNPTTITAVTPMQLEVMSVREFRSAYDTMPTVRDHVDEQIDMRIHTWLSQSANVAELSGNVVALSQPASQ
jgi:CRP-like cAMP-binding protein